MNSQYINLVRELPPPTDEQIALFATFVSEAHSWYKHLPVSARVPFYFYLYPDVRRGLGYSEKGAEIQDCNGGGIHYTSQTTKEYRRRFGFLAYYKGSTRLPVFPQTTQETNLSSNVILSVYDSQRKSHFVPPALADLGKAYLSAFVHPDGIRSGRFQRFDSDFYKKAVLSALVHPDGMIMTSDLQSIWPIWPILQKLQADFPITHNPVVKGEIPAILKLFDSPSHPNYTERQKYKERWKKTREETQKELQVRKLSRPVQKTLEFLEALQEEYDDLQLFSLGLSHISWRCDEQLAEQTKALGGGTTTFVTLLQALEIYRTSHSFHSILVIGIKRLGEIEQQQVSPDLPDFIAEFHHAYVSERIRQLEDMKQAMYRFVEAVYHPHAPVTYFFSPTDQERCIIQHEKTVLAPTKRKVAIQKRRARHYEQGKQHYQARRYQEALTSFELVLECQADTPPALYYIACIYALQGEVKPAVAYLQKAIAIRADYRELARKSHAFDKIRQDESFQNLVVMRNV